MKILRSIYSIVFSIFFRPEKFFCKLDLGGDLQFKIWECPSEWCSNSELEIIYNDLHLIATESQQGKDTPDYGVLKAEKDDLKNRIITIGYDRKSKKPVGFSAQIYLNVPVGMSIIQVLHLGLVYVTPTYQKKSLLGLLYILPNILLLMKRGFRPLWTSNVSQVPSVIGVVADYYQNVFPNPIYQTRQTLLHKSLGRGIMKYYRKAFGTGEDAVYDPEKQIIYNSYTGGSDNLKKKFDECPKYRDNKVNIFCEEHLNYIRGDDFLQLGLLSSSLISNFFNKKIAGVSRIQMFFYLIITAFITTLLPVLRWLTRKTN